MGDRPLIFEIFSNLIFLFLNIKKKKAPQQQVGFPASTAHEALEGVSCPGPHSPQVLFLLFISLLGLVY